MKLILKLAFRELKNSKKFALFFITNLSIGILGFLILHSFKLSVNESLDARAKILLASDISISSRKDLSQNQIEKIDKILSPYILNRANITGLYSMGQGEAKNKRSRLLLIKMISNNYPLFGQIKLQNYGVSDKALKADLKNQKEIWISKDMAHQLKLVVGDYLKLGKLRFKVRDIIVEDTTSSSAGISLAPKLYLHKRYQKDLGLISQGSVASYTYQYELSKTGLEKIKILQKEILDELNDPAFKVLLPENSSEQVGRVLNYLSDYLGLVSLVAIFLSTIGAAFLFQDFVFKKIVDIAILKSLGLQTKSIFYLFSSQLLFLGGTSVLISSVLGGILLPLGSGILSDAMGVPVSLSLNFESILVSFIIGMVLTFIISFPIIQKLISKKTHDLFGGEKNLVWDNSKKDILKFLPLVIAMEVLSVWQSHSLLIGTAFTLILIISSGVLFLFIPYLLTLLDKLFISKDKLIQNLVSIEFGLSLRFLTRAKIATTLTFLSICIGVMLLSLISQLEVSLNSELLGDKVKKPSLFMFDIQAEQKKPLEEFSREKNIPLTGLTPMVRARISKIDGTEFNREDGEKDFQTREDEQRVRFRNRGINLTYSNKLNHTQTIVKGKPFDGIYSGEGNFEISLDQRYAKRINAKLGSTMTLDVLGVEFRGVVTSLRKIKWTSFLPNFFITLQEGVVEDAPQSYLGVIDELSEKRQLDVQDQIVEKFPNISMINVTELLNKISSVFSSMSVAIKVMAYLCILVGFFVVYAIIQNQLRKKEYDILLLKSFGMSSKQIMKIFIIQFLKISFTATVFGCGLSLLVGNLLSQVFFDGVWQIDFVYFLSILLIMCLMTVLLVIFCASGVYKKPIRSLLE